MARKKSTKTLADVVRKAREAEAKAIEEMQANIGKKIVELASKGKSINDDETLQEDLQNVVEILAPEKRKKAAGKTAKNVSEKQAEKYVAPTVSDDKKPENNAPGFVNVDDENL